METPIDSLLDKIRLNCVYLKNKHINNHLYYKHAGKWFDIPIIILSVFAGSFSVSADQFAEQGTISVINCSIAMFIRILTSVKIIYENPRKPATRTRISSSV